MLIIFAAFVGLIVGSMINVVVSRLPEMLESEWRQMRSSNQNHSFPNNFLFSLVFPEKFCSSCGRRVSIIHHISILRFFLRGKCQDCKTNSSARYPMVELIGSMTLGLIVWKLGFSIQAVALFVFMMAMLMLALIDIDVQLLPNCITIPLIWLGLLYNLHLGLSELKSAVIGAVLGYLFLWGLYWVFKWITGKEGMGFGDFKMFSAIGACLGWQALPVVLFVSSLMASLVGLGLLFFAGKNRNTEIPFGPYLSLGGVLVVLLLKH